MTRSIAYRRFQRHRAICKKKAKSRYRLNGGDWYDVDGKYDKGKIHCSCGICKPCKGLCELRYKVKDNEFVRNAMIDYYELEESE